MDVIFVCKRYILLEKVTLKTDTSTTLVLYTPVMV